MMLVNVCACFDVTISHGWPAKLPRPCSFFLFDRSAYFFSFSFFFLQCFWPCPFFFLQGLMLSWNSYNLNRFAKPTRCHPFNSFLPQPGVIICMVVILFATRGSTPLKNDHDEEIKSQIFYWSCYMYCCERQGRKFQALRETKNTWNFFVIEPNCSTECLFISSRCC